MESTDQQGTSTVVTVALALLAGLAVWALLLPWGGCDDIETSACFSMFRWYTVPDQWVAWAAGAATAGIVGVALLLRDRGR